MGAVSILLLSCRRTSRKSCSAPTGFRLTTVYGTSGRGRLFVDGRAAVTLSRKRPLCCRRVFVQHDAVLPPRQETAVSARSTLLSPRKTGADWIIDSHHVRPGLYVGRTLLPASHHDIKVRMVNTTAEPQVLSRGTCLGSLQPVDVMEPPTSAPSSASASASSAIPAPKATLWLLT